MVDGGAVETVNGEVIVCIVGLVFIGCGVHCVDCCSTGKGGSIGFGSTEYRGEAYLLDLVWRCRICYGGWWHGQLLCCGGS